MVNVKAFRVYLFIAVITQSPVVLSNDVIQLNRYQRLDVSQSEQAKDLMSSVIDVTFPDSVTTIGDAIRLLLQTSGFQLDLSSQAFIHQYILFTLPLPETHRRLPPQSLENAITLLAGEAYTFSVNPVYREVGFILKKEYAKFASQKRAQSAKERWLGKPVQKQQVTSNADTLKYPAKKLEYGPVRGGETLTQIAKTLPLSWLTLDQQLVALFKANPSAFLDSNMNHLQVGAVITVPFAKNIDEVPEREATAIVNAHEARWKQIKRQ